MSINVAATARPDRAVAFLKLNGLKGDVYTPLWWGSYLTWELYEEVPDRANVRVSIDGRNVTIDWRWSEGKAERLPSLALELVQLKVDIIVVAGTQATRAAKEVTSRPIVSSVIRFFE